MLLETIRIVLLLVINNMLLQILFFTTYFITVPVSITARNIIIEQYPVATVTSIEASTELSLSRYEGLFEDYDEQTRKRARRQMDDDHMESNSNKAIKNDPWQGYYDFLINEGSFKFWAVFQIVTAAILIYSAFAAVYYAKYNFIQADYDYNDDFFGRSNSISDSNLWSGLTSETFQRILDAISSKKYS